MSKIRTRDEIAVMKEAGKRLAFVLDHVGKLVKPGAVPTELDKVAEKLILEGGDQPTFKGYRAVGARYAFPASMCISPNDTVVHGIPKDVPLVEGDVVVLDIGLTHKGFIVDMARTYPVGKISPDAGRLIATTREALMKGIGAARDGAHVGDIGAAVSSHVRKNGCEIVRELGGHGVGKKLHEDPYIPNFGTKGEGPVLRAGMTVAIEPIVTLGRDGIRLMEDEWTLKTLDGKWSAQFEHTILITKKGAEILTK